MVFVSNEVIIFLPSALSIPSTLLPQFLHLYLGSYTLRKVQKRPKKVQIVAGVRKIVPLPSVIH